MLAPWKKSYDQPQQHFKKQRHYFANKGPSSQSYGFSSSHVWMWELDYRESWAPKNWCFWTVVLEKSLESALDCMEIQPVHPQGNQYWIFIGRTDAEAETPILWSRDVKNWLILKDPDTGKDWRWEDKGMTEDEMVGWHHQLDGCEFEQALGVGWWTRRPGVLQSMGSQRVRHDWATELNWTDSSCTKQKGKKKTQLFDIFRETIITLRVFWTMPELKDILYLVRSINIQITSLISISIRTKCINWRQIFYLNVFTSDYHIFSHCINSSENLLRSWILIRITLKRKYFKTFS